ncbi:S-methyl-5-thioribose kinase [Pseudorhodobacter turbinis]|uniref:S-methyl-5-thioribose kinase n=1 Tax=Pseudorhodobacter turbinis TaxID=2500533 RepID=UPI00197F823D|nr:S-methyl-5-thioribose kinase [Pseudorhodobacter turbinis]
MLWIAFERTYRDIMTQFSPQDNNGVSNSEGLRGHIAAQPDLLVHFGADLDVAEISEIGDGNLNFIFHVRTPKVQMAIKHAPSWSRISRGTRALTRDRLGFEARALRLFRELAPLHVPTVYTYDADASMLAMEFITPHEILRKGLMAGQEYPDFADHISTYLANCLFNTSDFALKPSDKRQLVAEFSRNVELCEITERLVFTDAFVGSDDNRWTRPQLDAAVVRIQSDPIVRMRVEQLKLDFLTRTDALLHGDLHTGSIMATSDETFVIDPEFAVFGPMGFDIGMMIGNLLLGFFILPAHGGSDAQRENILNTIETLWEGFVQKFATHWQKNRDGGVFAYANFAAPVLSGATDAFLHSYLARVLDDAVGYAAVEVVRRLIGRAHVPEFDAIKDDDLRARHEAQAFQFAYNLLRSEENINAIGQMTAQARAACTV